MMDLNPERDGVDHINISFIAKSKLGKLLNDFSNVPTVDENGISFKSAYSYLCYLKTGSSDVRFTELNAKDSHRLFLLLKRNDGVPEVWVPDLLNTYWKVLRNRLERNESLKELFYSNDLPIVSYILTNEGNVIIRKIDNGVVSRYNRLLKLSS